MDGVTTVPVSGTPPDVTWWQSADGTAHAFRGLRQVPVCRAWWATRVAQAPELMPWCADCELLLVPITESEARLMDGNR